VAVPGIALCWGLAVSRIDSRNLRLLLCAALVTVSAYICLTTQSFRRHQHSWKYAVAITERNASADNATVLICSDLPEADHMRMPEGAAIAESGILPQLSYYKLTVPVVPLPRALNDEAIRSGRGFCNKRPSATNVFWPWPLSRLLPRLTGCPRRLEALTTSAN
jgi:hypothetical protein